MFLVFLKKFVMWLLDLLFDEKKNYICLFNFILFRKVVIGIEVFLGGIDLRFVF